MTVTRRETCVVRDPTASRTDRCSPSPIGVAPDVAMYAREPAVWDAPGATGIVTIGAVLGPTWVRPIGEYRLRERSAVWFAPRRPQPASIASTASSTSAMVASDAGSAVRSSKGRNECAR